MRSRLALLLGLMLTSRSWCSAENQLVSTGDLARPPQPVGYWTETFEMPPSLMKTSYDINILSMEDRFLLLSLGGILAKQSRQPRLLLTTSGGESVWLNEFSKCYDGSIYEVAWGPWKIIEQFLSQVSGYVVYTKSQGEVGTTKAANLAGALNAVMVCEEMVPQAQELGLTELGNVSPLSETQIFHMYPSYFQHLAIVEGMDWGWQWPWNFYWYIASKTFVLTIRADGWTTDKCGILPLIPQKGPVFGWSTAVSEHDLVDPLGRHGFGIVAGNAMGNLPVLYTPRPGEHFPILEGMQRHKTLRDLSWEDNVHYVSIYLSDMGNCDVIYRYWTFWDSPVRRDENRGWGFNAACPVGIAQEVFPIIYRHLYRTGTSNDFFFSEVSGAGGYFFPDHWSLDDPEAPTLREHIARDAWNQAASGLNVFMIMVSGSTGFDPWLSNYTETLGRPLGVVYYKHYPHEAFAYQMTWVPDERGWQVPVAAVDQVAWQGYRLPSEMAANVNTNVHLGAPNTRDHYTVAFVNYWSDFGPEGSRFEAMKTFVSNLESWTRVVTLEEYFLTMRLRMRPAEFLSRFLDGLDECLRRLAQQTPPTCEAAVALQQAQGYRDQARQHLQQFHMRDCFLTAQQAEAAFERTRLSFIQVKQEGRSLQLRTAQPLAPQFYFHPYELVSATATLKFKARDLYLVRQFEIQLCESADFSEPFASEFITNDSYMLPEREGPYFGRVRAQGEEHGDWGGWSMIFQVPQRWTGLELY